MLLTTQSLVIRRLTTEHPNKTKDGYHASTNTPKSTPETILIWNTPDGNVFGRTNNTCKTTKVAAQNTVAPFSIAEQFYDIMTCDFQCCFANRLSLQAFVMQALVSFRP